MPNYKCECPSVFGGDDAQRDRDMHMDSCEFVKVRKERDALLLQIETLKKEAENMVDNTLTACRAAYKNGFEDQKKESDRIFEEARKIIADVAASPKFKKWYCYGLGEQDPCGVHAFTEKHRSEKWEVSRPKIKMVHHCQASGAGCHGVDATCPCECEMCAETKNF